MKIGKDTPAVVTGGASGLGEATARMLAGHGAKVAIFDMNADRGEKLAKEIGGLFCSVDVTSEAAVDAGLAKARAAHGTERIVVCCAGIATAKRTVAKNKETGEFVPHDVAGFTKVVMVNLIGTFQVMAKSAAAMSALAPVNEDGTRGVMVSTASVAAQDGQIGQIAYGASKAGVLGMTLPMARDMAQYGVRVMNIMPGMFMTPLVETLPQQSRDSLAASIPFPSRFGDPKEYAALVEHIVSNELLNGFGIRLDGAIRMAPR